MSGSIGAEQAVSDEKVELEQARFKQRLSQLGQLLEHSVPGYEELLKQIHRNLANDENLLHILDEKEIGIIMAGLARRKNIVIATTAQKAAGKKKVKTEEDFM